MGLSSKLVHAMITHHFKLALESPDPILERICSGDRRTTCLIFGGAVKELPLPFLQLGWLLIGPGTIPPSTTSWRVWLHAVQTLLLAGLADNLLRNTCQTHCRRSPANSLSRACNSDFNVAPLAHIDLSWISLLSSRMGSFELSASYRPSMT